jgi:hypothetical protein
MSAVLIRHLNTGKTTSLYMERAEAKQYKVGATYHDASGPFIVLSVEL